MKPSSDLLESYDYPLPPPEQIAQYPLEKRSASRLLCYLQGQSRVSHHHFADIVDYLSPGDLLVFNNTRVIPARLFGKKITGGQVEILLERVINERQFLAHVHANKSLQPHAIIELSIREHNSQAHYALEFISRQEDLFLLQLSDSTPGNVYDCLTACGHIPLPPYIQREAKYTDENRYQTIYAKHPGAVAAPTAGLHFDEGLLTELEKRGVHQAFLTLHVGAGTFQPVRVSSIEDHKMHSEYIEVDAGLCQQILATKRKGNRVIAVGTTVVRALETAALSGQLQPYTGDTDIFITPGFSFRVIDGLITNFHWPRSTLLMLVAALIPRERLLQLYQEAITAGYRFFSYGDAMLIFR